MLLVDRWFQARTFENQKGQGNRKDEEAAESQVRNVSNNKREYAVETAQILQCTVYIPRGRLRTRAKALAFLVFLQRLRLL